MKNLLETSVEEIRNEKKAKAAMIVGGALSVVGISVPLGYCVTDVISIFNNSAHHVLFKNLESAVITGGIILGAGLASAIYGTFKYWNYKK